jgi:hypothetical protein
METKPPGPQRNREVHHVQVCVRTLQHYTAKQLALHLERHLERTYNS